MVYTRTMTTNENTEATETTEETRTMVLSGRKIVQKWDGLGWVTISDTKASE